MKVVLSEFVSDKWKEVWSGIVDVAEDAEENDIVTKAFEASLINYIGACFPEGFGLKEEMVTGPTAPGVISRIFNCSGRNVKIKYGSDGVIVDDRSVRDRDFRVDVSK